VRVALCAHFEHGDEARAERVCGRADYVAHAGLKRNESPVTSRGGGGARRVKVKIPTAA
jgi:hypothetical protein